MSVKPIYEDSIKSIGHANIGLNLLPSVLPGKFNCKPISVRVQKSFAIFARIFHDLFSPCTSVLMSKVYLICKRLICSLHAILFIIQIGFVAVLVVRFERIHLRLFARKSRGNKFYIIISKKMILKFYCVCTFVSLVDEFRVVLSTDNQCDYYNAVIFSV